MIAQRKLKKEIEKLEQQKALDQERMRISQEMHDDIGAGLTQINLISEAASIHARQGANIHNELHDISATSRQLVDNIGEIIWALNPHHSTLDILLSHVREQIGNLVEYAGMNATIRFPVVDTSIELNNQQRRNTLLVTKEIVHNAIKYSEAKNIYVEASYLKGCLTFIVTDDGIGFNSNQSYPGNGLKNIRQRISEMNGSLEISSEPGKGTRFVYYFDLA